MITFLKISNVDDDKSATLRGNLFEGLAHQQLQQGGKFKIRNLESEEPEESEIVLEPTTWCFFHNARDLIGMLPMQYLKPFSKRFCAIDAVMATPVCLLQMTLSSHHPVSASVLREILQTLREV